MPLAAPGGRERAKNLLWAAGKLADYTASLGLDLVPGVVLHPSRAERFTRCAPGLSGAARQTLRRNLRFIGRRVVPQAAFEEITGASGAVPRIEAMLPAGVRTRQLSVRTLLAGMCLTLAGHRPAHLTRIHQALTAPLLQPAHRIAQGR